MENKGLLALFSIHQGRWVYLFSEMTIVLGRALRLYSLTHLINFCLALWTVTLELLTGIHGKATDCNRCIDVDNSRRHNASMTVSQY